MAKINLITDAEQKSLDASVSPYTYEIKDSNSRTTTIVVKVARNLRGEIKKKIEAKKSTSSKQNWEIVLSNAKEKVVMNMTIRTNKPKPENKVAQGFNLAIKFNGLS